MAKFILGKKLAMTQVFEENGKVTPVTLVELEPNTIIQVKTKDKDGYEAVQVGTGTKRKVSKPLKGHLGSAGSIRFMREFKTAGQELKVGDKIDFSLFAPGDLVKISAVTKGKGFQGAVKRHGFKGMPASHGHRAVQRHVGSIGQRFPQHTRKGMRMAGHMGNRNLTIPCVIVRVDAESGILAVKGALPGQRGGLLKIVGQ